MLARRCVRDCSGTHANVRDVDCNVESMKAWSIANVGGVGKVSHVTMTFEFTNANRSRARTPKPPDEWKKKRT